MEKRPNIRYTSLPVLNGQLQINDGCLEEWQTEMEWFNKEIEWLLEQSFQK